MTTLLGGVMASVPFWYFRTAQPQRNKGRRDLARISFLFVLLGGEKKQASMLPANDDGCQLVFHQNDSAGKASLESAKRWPSSSNVHNDTKILYIFSMRAFFFANILQLNSISIIISWTSRFFQTPFIELFSWTLRCRKCQPFKNPVGKVLRHEESYGSHLPGDHPSGWGKKHAR